jgi:hypothetical protein
MLELVEYFHKQHELYRNLLVEIEEIVKNQFSFVTELAGSIFVGRLLLLPDED